jgi:gamma-glutamylcyclotransferase (GGCT)/AIG2-like uncharacterized protein YtfP
VNLFVYGTLRDAALVRRLTGRQFSVEAAVLAGYRRFEPPGSYPYITPEPHAEVHGDILRNVDADTLQVFDAYENEGRLYRRVDVWVTISGRREPAQAYVADAPVRRE